MGLRAAVRFRSSLRRGAAGGEDGAMSEHEWHYNDTGRYYFCAKCDSKVADGIIAATPEFAQAVFNGICKTETAGTARNGPAIQERK